MSQAKQVITHEVSISQEFYAEMARVVGSVGEYLIFDGQEEAINYLKDADCLIFREEADIYEYITDTEERAEVMKEHLKDNYNCRIIDDGDDCLVFEDMDEARQEVADNSDVGDVFSQSAIETWVAENSSIEDVFNEDEIVEWVQENISIDEMFEWFEDDAIKASVSFKKRFGEAGVLFTVEEDTARQQVKKLTADLEKITERTCDYEFILKENEELKKKNVALNRAFDDMMLLRNIISDLIFNNRTAKDGQVWKFNSNDGHGEWC